MIYIAVFLICLLPELIWCRKKQYRLTKNDRDMGMVLILTAVAMVITMSDCIFGQWKVSFSNLLYARPPFDSLGTAVKGPFLSDIIDAFLPDISDKITNGNLLHIWNSANAFGYPDYSFSWLDIKYILYAFGLEFGQNALFLIKYFLAGAGMYLFLKKVGLRTYSAYLGGITYAFSSAMVVWHGWPHTDVMAYGPFLFYFVEDALVSVRAGGEFKLRNMILFSGVLFLMLVTGMPTYVPFFIYTGILYLVCRVMLSFRWKRDKRTILALFLGFGISAVVAGMMSLVYTGSLMNSTAEYAERRTGQVFDTLDTDYLRTILVPYVRDGLPLHINESTLFTGFVFLFLVPVCLVKRQENEHGHGKMLSFWAVVLVATLLFIFDDDTGVLYQFIPLLNTSSKIRIIALFNFAAAILSAFCLDTAMEGDKHVSVVKSFALYIIPGLTLLELSDLRGNQDAVTAVWVTVLVAVCLQIVLLRKSQWAATLLCLVVTVQMGSFAKEYTPMIPKDADVIPAATDSVRYLQEHTQNGERFVSIGTWNLFPNVNRFYGLNDLRFHGFVNTNEDVKTYMTGIDSEAYKSPTRTEIIKIDNENLLKYASVAYITRAIGGASGKLTSLDNLIAAAQTSRIPLAYDGNGELRQTFSSDTGFSAVHILMSTYERKLSASDFITVEISDKAGKNYGTERICLGALEDNAFYSVATNVPAAPGDYVLRITGEGPFELPLAFWETESPIYDGVFCVDDARQVGSLCFVLDQPGYLFDDGTAIEALEDSAPRAYLAEDVVIVPSAADALERMKQEYVPSRVFVTANQKAMLTEQSGYETSRVLEYTDEQEKVTVKVDGAKGEVLVLTDYYTDDWDVYVDGEQADCLKVNYLFRGVVLPEDGEHEITFVYHDRVFMLCAGLSVLGAVCLLAAVIFRKRLQSAVTRLIALPEADHTEREIQERENETDHSNTMF